MWPTDRTLNSAVLCGLTIPGDFGKNALHVALATFYHFTVILWSNLITFVERFEKIINIIGNK